MICSRVFSRVSRNGFNLYRALLASNPPPHFPISYNRFHQWCPSLLLHQSVQNTLFSQRFGISTASPNSTEKENNQDGGNGASVGDNGSSATTESTKSSADMKAEETMEDTDSDEELSIEELVKLVEEKEELLKIKHKEIETMQDKVLRSYAEMENVMDRKRREAESSKKFAIQNFAKSLLDVADNLGRASSVVKVSFSKVDTSTDTSGAVPLLKTLLEGVEMTEKQLTEVFKKFGIEKFDPINEHFDPHRHHAVFRIPDGSKDPDTVAAVLKPGYLLYDRVIRPAEVGVAVSPNGDEAK